MKIWFNLWRFEFYFGIHWYYHDSPWYVKHGKVFEVRRFDQIVDIAISLLFLYFSASYSKRWNGRESPDSKFHWI